MIFKVFLFLYQVAFIMLQIAVLNEAKQLGLTVIIRFFAAAQNDSLITTWHFF